MWQPLSFDTYFLWKTHLLYRSSYLSVSRKKYTFKTYVLKHKKKYTSLRARSQRSTECCCLINLIFKFSVFFDARATHTYISCSSESSNTGKKLKMPQIFGHQDWGLCSTHSWHGSMLLKKLKKYVHISIYYLQTVSDLDFFFLIENCIEKE